VKKKALFGLLVLTLVVMPLFAACAEEEPTPPPPPPPGEVTPPPTEPPEVIKLKVATTTPVVAPPAAAITEWAKKVEELSEGRVKFTIYYSSSLFEAKEVLTSVMAGVADISDYWTQEDAGIMLLSNMTWLPCLGWPDPDKSTRLWREMFDKYPELTAEYQGLKVLYPLVGGETTSYYHTVNKQIKSRADLKGMKVIGSGYVAKWEILLGATPVYVAYEDSYMALDKGVVEGHGAPWGWMEGSGTVELTPYHTILGPGMMSGGYQPLVMNPDSWNSLPPDIQQIFEELDPFYTDLRNGYGLESETRLVKYTQEELGHTFYTLPPEETQLWMDLGKQVHEEYIELIEAKGKPGREFYDELVRLIAEYSK